MQKLSRRDFAKKAACVAAGLSAGTVALPQAAQSTQDKGPAVTDAEIDAAQSQLNKPLDGQAKDILKADLISQKKDTAARLKLNLPENSEPCFIFLPTPKAKPEKDEGGVG